MCENSCTHRNLIWKPHTKNLLYPSYPGASALCALCTYSSALSTHCTMHLIHHTPFALWPSTPCTHLHTERWLAAPLHPIPNYKFHSFTVLKMRPTYCESVKGHFWQRCVKCEKLYCRWTVHPCLKSFEIISGVKRIYGDRLLAFLWRNRICYCIILVERQMHLFLP